MNEVEVQLKWCKEFLEHSQDPSTKVAACLVVPKIDIVGQTSHFVSRAVNRAVNGFTGDLANLTREDRLKVMVHAEMCAILGCMQIHQRVHNSTLYIACKSNDVYWGGICSNCAKHAIVAGVNTVWTLPSALAPERWHEDLALARRLLTQANVSYNELT